jgi:hypothetical protein
MNNLNGLLKAQGHLEDSSRRVFCMLMLALGPSHPQTFTSMLNLATLLADVNEHEAAAALLPECFAGMQRVLGRDHPDTINCKKWMRTRVNVSLHCAYGGAPCLSSRRHTAHRHAH